LRKPEYIHRRGRTNFTAPALTAVDLAAEDGGGDVIDRALRSKRQTGVTIDALLGGVSESIRPALAMR
jgi:hypothetical protein